MKYFRMLALIGVLSFVGASFTACGDATSATEQQGKEYTSAYICPMYCDGSGSEEAGTCPVCGMDYVKNETTDDTSHAH